MPLVRVKRSYPPQRRLRKKVQQIANLSQCYPPQRRLRKLPAVESLLTSGYPPQRRLRNTPRAFTDSTSCYPPQRRLRNPPARRHLSRWLVTRRRGGLENRSPNPRRSASVTRRRGGLENFRTGEEYSDIRYPPQRRLRNVRDPFETQA